MRTVSGRDSSAMPAACWLGPATAWAWPPGPFPPVELFLDPTLVAPKATIGWKLARRAMGFRVLLGVIPLDTSLVKGSHGRITDSPEQGPLVISSEPMLLPEGPIAATAIKQLVLDHVFEQVR